MCPYDEFDLDRVRAESFVDEIVYHDQLTSTNTEAIELSRRPDIGTPLLVLARHQTGGRGRGANSWWSSPGSLTFTLLVDLSLASTSQIGPVSLTIGVAVTQALEKLAPCAEIGLKWPNDVYLEGKKITGILVERPPSPDTRLAIGVGINANNSFVGAPHPLRTTAISLVDHLQEPIEITCLLIECLQHLEARLADHVNNRDAVLDQWRAYHVLTGKAVVVKNPGATVIGICQGIDAEGAILVQQGTNVHRCVAGTVRLC